MIETMRLGRHIAGLASAALLAAVMLFAPTVAQAHSGPHRAHHDHAHHGVAAMAQDAPAHSVHQATSSAHQHHAVASATTQDTSDQSGNCTDGCCGSGLGCCGAAALASPSHLPDIAHRGVSFSFAFDRRAGIDPDALKRPPRSLA